MENPRARLLVIDSFAKVKPNPGKGSAYDADTEAPRPRRQMALQRGVSVLELTYLRNEKLDVPLEMSNGSICLAIASTVPSS